MRSFDLLAAIKSYTIRMNPICIITALPAESRVFIDALKLKPILDHGWRLYGHSEYLLLQTGLGKLKAAAAVSALLHTRHEIRAIINAGIAGGHATIGDAFLVHHLSDKGTGEQWYPHLPPQRVIQAMPTAGVLTLDRPSSEYQADTLFDMEASGIMSAASHYLSTDAIQFIKVISDNAESPLSAFKPARVTELMQPTVATVINIAEWFRETGNSQAHAFSTQALHDKVVSTIHHTATEKHQLLRVLQQHCALTGKLPAPSEMLEAKTASELIKKLLNVNKQIPLVYGDAS